MTHKRIPHLHKFRKISGRLLACLMAGILACGNVPVSVLASEDTSEASGESDDGVPQTEGQTYVLLASAGFSYAFSAKKVSLRDVEDEMYESGVITAKRTSSDNSLTLSVSAAETQDSEVSAASVSDAEETAAETSGETTSVSTEVSEDADASSSDAAETAASDASEGSGSEDDGDRVIEDTTLTPVQQKEQDVVDAVSETQNITVDTSTATILSATAVSVVTDTDTAVALAEMADKKQTQAKLDQGVISAVEAEALLAAQESNTSSSSSDGSTTSDTGTSSGEASSDTSSTDVTDTEDAETTQEETGETDETIDTTDTLTTVATDADGNEIVVAQVSDYINIRADASADAEIVGYLYNGSVATVLGRTGNGWVRIESGGIYGYIREEYVATGSTAAALAEEVATQQAVVTTETLRVRAAPQADADVISLIGEGETLDILEVVDGWYKVYTVDGEGYISADFADVEQVYPTAVAVEDTEEEETADDTSSTTSSSSGSSSSSSSYSSLNSYTGGSGSGTSSGSAVANYALQFVGNPYVWGGTSLTSGADCSGFTMAVYANFGVSLPHSSYSQASCGTAVASLDEAQPGDLLIYDGHVAIYLGNNQIVHASNPTNGICVGTATYRTIIAIRRIFN